MLPEMSDNLPLFPLRTVLFPAGPLPLRVFEPRYLDMIGRCMREEIPFGIVLALPSPEGMPIRMQQVGTLASISDWYQGSDGILGVTALGGQRFRLRSTEQQDDGLHLGVVELLDPESPLLLPEEFRTMGSLLQVVLDDLGLLYQGIEKDYGDAVWVGCRFAEVLPLSLEEKQHCLELNDPLERLRFVRPRLQELREEQTQ
jgi:Lon protease-like protein